MNRVEDDPIPAILIRQWILIEILLRLPVKSYSVENLHPPTTIRRVLLFSMHPICFFGPRFQWYLVHLIRSAERAICSFEQAYIAHTMETGRIPPVVLHEPIPQQKLMLSSPISMLRLVLLIMHRSPPTSEDVR